MSSQLDRASLSSTSLIGPPGTTRPPSRAALADSLRSKSLSPQSAWEQKEGSRLSYGRMGISPTSRPTTASRDGSSSASPSPTGKSARRRSSGRQCQHRPLLCSSSVIEKNRDAADCDCFYFMLFLKIMSLIIFTFQLEHTTPAFCRLPTDWEIPAVYVRPWRGAGVAPKLPACSHSPCGCSPE